MPMTYRLAMAAGRDAGNRNAAQHGRSTWTRADYRTAAAVVARLMGAA